MPQPDRRRALLVAALAFLPPQEDALRALHAWLDSWSGIGLIVVGMERQGHKVSLRNIAADGWVCSFQSDPSLASSGFGSGSLPWLATQRAAWAVVKRLP
jgi:hypothetical protein